MTTSTLVERRRLRVRLALISLSAIFCCGLSAQAWAQTAAGETIAYHYDAKGRLTQIAHSGGRNDGLISTYTFDASDNRTAASVVGAHPGVVVVPLNGLTVIFLS